MDGQAFALQRPPLFDADDLARIEQAALRLLDQVGVAVLDTGLLAQLTSRGFRAVGNRVLIQPEHARGFLEAERERNGRRFSHSPSGAGPGASAISLLLNPYAQFVHDLEADRIVPFTTERLIEATRLADVLCDRGVASSPPGCPTDAAPALQPVLQYWVAATYSRQGRHPVDAKSRGTLPYVMEMAEVLGHPIRHLPVYVFSPLTLGGESLLCVLEFRRTLSSVHVCSMPGAGSTAPVGAADGFALAAAEVVGSALLLTEALEMPVSWGVALFPVDFAGMAMVFGSPEAGLLQLASAEVDAYFHGWAWPSAAGTVHTMAKVPGPQACAEKASLMTLNGLLGQRSFGGAGALSLDEVFSAEQLLYDLEIRDHVEGLIGGLGAGCEPERCVSEVREALQQGSFLALETTAQACRELRRPALFERGFLSAWLAEGGRTIRSRARSLVRDLVGRHEYALKADLQRELDTVLARARAALT